MTKAQTKTVTKSKRPESKKGYNTQNEFLEHITVKGEVLKVFTPPMELILTITSGPKPSVPDHVMKTKTGDQIRPAKEGDSEYVQYLFDKDTWEEDTLALRNAVKIVTALREIEYPDTASMTFPEHVQRLIDLKVLIVPKHEILRQSMWLRATVLEAQQDEQEVDFKIQQLSGIPEEVVETIRNNFWDFLRKPFAESMGAPSQESSDIE